MTIAAAYLTSEGVALAADSTITIGSVLQLMNHNQKVFEVGEDSCFGLCTFGAGIVGVTSHRSIAALLRDWIDGQPSPPTTEDVAAQLATLVKSLSPTSAQIPAGAQFQVGYYLGGRDPGTRTPRCFRISVSADHANPPAESIAPLGIGAQFSGQPMTFNRVFLGIDPQLQQLLRANLAQLVSPNNPTAFESQFDTVIQALIPRFAAQGYTDLPIRDAIDYLHAMLHVTVKTMKFKYGVPACGGPIELGFITTDRNFRWVLHKSFDSAIHEHLNLQPHPWTR